MSLKRHLVAPLTLATILGGACGHKQEASLPPVIVLNDQETSIVDRMVMQAEDIAYAIGENKLNLDKVRKGLTELGDDLATQSDTVQAAVMRQLEELRLDLGKKIDAAKKSGAVLEVNGSTYVYFITTQGLPEVTNALKKKLSAGARQKLGSTVTEEARAR